MKQCEQEGKVLEMESLKDSKWDASEFIPRLEG